MTEILHMVPSSLWQAAAESGWYIGSTRGASLDQVGYIHCSTADLIAPVARAVYGEFEEALVVLVLDDAAVRASGVQVRFEDGGDGNLYPHVYGPLDVQLVQQVLPAGFTAEGEFWWGARP